MRRFVADPAQIAEDVISGCENDQCSRAEMISRWKDVIGGERERCETEEKDGTPR